MPKKIIESPTFSCFFIAPLSMYCRQLILESRTAARLSYKYSFPEGIHIMDRVDHDNEIEEKLSHAENEDDPFDEGNWGEEIC